MKFIVLLALVLSTSTTFAKDKKSSRKPASTSGACESQAGEVAAAAVKALGQDVTIESVRTDFIKSNHETYKVKLKGNGFSSAETNKMITVKLWDMGDGCGLDSIEMPMELKRDKND